MAAHQKTITLRPRSRGFHLVTAEVAEALSAMPRVEAGVLHVFIQHTSASLCLNENADPDVRADLEAHFLRAVPDAAPYFRHTAEGPDDMSAHVKAVTLGASVTVPVAQGRMLLGTWQGLYLGEHRVRATARTLVLTLVGK